MESDSCHKAKVLWQSKGIRGSLAHMLGGALVSQLVL
jgi:hypothetical protein